jgi:hypothetical protein
VRYRASLQPLLKLLAKAPAQADGKPARLRDVSTIVAATTHDEVDDPTGTEAARDR